MTTPEMLTEVMPTPTISVREERKYYSGPSQKQALIDEGYLPMDQTSPAGYAYKTIRILT